jgi:Lon protease-like protein
VAPPTINRLPLFPLDTVLFPGGLLPLQIFEVRYLHMIGACQRDGSVFGVVALQQGTEVQRPGAESIEAFQSLGTLARIVDFVQTAPGLMQIRCIGEQRFRIQRQEKLAGGLWVADVTSIAPDPFMPIPDDLAGVAGKLGELIRILQARRVPAEQMPLAPPYELEDCAWVANRWSELLPLDTALRQDLLAQESPLLRLELISDFLDRTELPF